MSAFGRAMRRILGLTPPEDGRHQQRWQVTSPGWTESGTWVDEREALRLDAVYACVRVLSNTISSLPLVTYRRLPEGGKEPATGHRLYQALHSQPVPTGYAGAPPMTSVMWRRTACVHLLLWGNCYAAIIRDGRGAPIGLHPLMPTPETVRVETAGGRLEYVVYPNRAAETILPPADIIHVRGLSVDGVMGISPIEAQREILGEAIAVRQHGTRFFGNGANPGGVLETDQKLSPEAVDNLRRSFEGRHGGVINSHKVAVLEQGLSFKPLSISPRDAQYIEGRKFSVASIARIFGVPPHMIGDLERATFSNIEHQSIDYVVHSIQPWLILWEQELNAKLFANDQSLFCEHLVSGLLRGDATTRAGFYSSMVQNGIMTRNEARSKENLNALEGLDRPLVPLNMLQDEAPSDG